MSFDSGIRQGCSRPIAQTHASQRREARHSADRILDKLVVASARGLSESS